MRDLGGLRRQRRRLTALASSALLLLSSSSAFGARVAVVGVGVDDDEVIAQLAIAARAEVKNVDGDAVVVDVSEIEARLKAPAGAVVDINTAKGLVDAAEVAFNAVEHEKSVGLLEDAIEQLEADTTFSTEKLTLLQEARLRCARRLVGLAGPTETGKAETKNGARARSHLAAALRADPTLILDPAQAPPKLITLLGAASDEVKRGGHGAIAVHTVPEGATIVLEGRPMGQTPLVTANTIAAGSYRLWAEKDGQRSFPREIVIGETTIEATIRLGLEGAYFPAGPGLKKPIAPYDEDGVSRLVSRLGADVVVVVGRADGENDAEGAQVFAAAFNDAGAVVHAVAGAGLGGADLAAVVKDGPADASLVPATFYAPSAASPAAAVVAEDGPPWLLIGAGVAGIAVVGAAAAVAAAVFLGPEQPTVGITLRKAE